MTDYEFNLDCENGGAGEFLCGGPAPLCYPFASLGEAIEYGMQWARESGRDGSWTSGVARLTISTTDGLVVHAADLGHVDHLGPPVEA